MKINSSFKDVYDAMVMYGVDEKQVLNRIQKRIDIPVQPGRYSADREDLMRSALPDIAVPVIDRLLRTAHHTWDRIQFGYLFFCGQIIPCLMKVDSLDRYRYMNDSLQAEMIPPEDVFYPKDTPEETEKALMVWAERCGLHEHINSRLSGLWYSRRRKGKTYADAIIEVLHEPVGIQPEQVRSVLEALDVVYLFLHVDNRPKVILYPSLKDLQLLKCMDIMTIYQEIVMFHSSTMVREDQPPVILADEYRQAAHGFDHKYAFRKRKA